MSLEVNKELVRNYMRRLTVGEELDEAFAQLGPDLVYWASSTEEPGGVSMTPEQYQLGTRAFINLFATPLEFIEGRATAEGDRVALEFSSRGGVTHAGTPYGNDYHMLFVVRDGKIREIREYNNFALVAPLMPEMMAEIERLAPGSWTS